MNKLIIFSILTFFFNASLSANDHDGWLNNLDSAISVAKSQDKLILLNFSGSDWCIQCKKMKAKVFDDSLFVNFADSTLVLMNIDFRANTKSLSKEQKAYNEKMAEKYNKKGVFPLTILINSEGEVIAEWKGYRGESPEEIITSIQTEIGKTNEE